MPCSANFSSLFELRPLAEDLTPNELHGLLPLFAASAPALKLKVGNRIGSHFVSNKLTHYCRLTVFERTFSSSEDRRNYGNQGEGTGTAIRRRAPPAQRKKIHFQSHHHEGGTYT